MFSSFSEHPNPETSKAGQSGLKPLLLTSFFKGRFCPCPGLTPSGRVRALMLSS